MSEYELRCRFNHPTHKVYRDIHDGGFASYRANLAQNGSDGFNFTIWSNDPVEGIHVFAENPTSPSGQKLTVETFVISYLPVRNRPTPDPLVPGSGPIYVDRNNSPSFYVRVKAPKDAPAGIYTGAIRVEKDKKVLNRMVFSARVWGFSLPDVPSCGTLFGLAKGFIKKLHESDELKTEELYKKYYDFLLDHKINAYSLPFDILDERADVYLDDPRVTSFQIPFPLEDDTLRAYHKKLSSNPEWFKKGVFYPIDEPSTPEGFDRYKEICQRLERLYPNYQIITPLGESRFRGGDLDGIAQLEPYQTRWCLRSDMFGDDGKAGYAPDDDRDAIFQKYGNVLSRMAKEREGGDDIWWYVCGFPYMVTYCDLNLDGSGASHRVLFWQQFAYDVEGLLYWRSNHWNCDGSPWEDPFTYDKVRPGDGNLLYNGNEVGIDGPVGSLRLEMVKNGIEDFEMLTMAKKLFTQEQVKVFTNPLINPSPSFNNFLYGTDAHDIFTYCDDDDAFYGARTLLGDALEAALRNQNIEK